MYALTLPRDDGPFPTVIAVTPSASFNPGAPVEPAPIEVEDPNFQMLYPPTWLLLIVSPETFYSMRINRADGETEVMVIPALREMFNRR